MPPDEVSSPAVPDAPAPAPAARRTRWSAVWSVAAVLLVWVALVAPSRSAALQPVTFVRLPLEGLLLGGALLALPARVRRPVAALAGLAAALLLLLKVLDLGFYTALDRPFDIVDDGGYAGWAVSLLVDSVGRFGAVVALVLGAAAVLAVLVLVPLAMLRVNILLGGHRAGAAAVLTALLAGWVGLAAAGTTVGAGPVASATDVRLALGHAHQVSASIRDERRFDHELTADPRAATGAALSGLRGKDVFLVFVESYGRFALEGPSSGPVTAVLDRGTRQLQRAGFRSRSAFLTSPTFGGVSWLAHSTLQSGLWVDSQQRYDRLLASRHSTLTSLFGQEGWRTVLDIPSSESPWTEGRRFYRYDRMYGFGDVGYTGPRFGYDRVPDQYTLEALHRLELSRQPRRPLMAEIDLASSHTPWAPLPHLVPWRDLGNGAVFDPMPAQGQSRARVWSDPARLRAAYSQSVVYTLRSLVGFLQRYGDDDDVLVVLGDHQPNSFVTGQGAGHDVPVSVIAHDPEVMHRIAGWDWQPGLHPRPDAPVWRMDAFRGRFLDAFDAPSPARPALGPPPWVRRQHVSADGSAARGRR
ncbi:MAG TPA: CDP-alcohol phosphatidyltransferase family protein [Nocardioidaceae bacterium]